MADAAAFFDLDRTLLRGASGPVLSAALRTAGVLDRDIPGESFVYGLFNRIGETRPSMALARQGARFSKGQLQADVRRAGEIAAEQLLPLVEPFAHPLIEHHRAAGRPTVLATTSPYDLVKPLADALGLTDVVATRYGVDADGRYDGTIDGEFVWGRGKLAAVDEWAEQHGIDLEDSYAYSDSYFDLPLLETVAHPIAVNPDPRMLLAATRRGWEIVGNGSENGVGRLLKNLDPTAILAGLRAERMVPYARIEISGGDKIPRSGGCIVVANHRSYFDSVVMAFVTAKSGRAARFLGKKEVFDAPIIGQLASMAGGIRVDRGTGSDEPLRQAADAIDAGDMVMLMPQGTIPRGPAFFDPTLKGRWGAAKLAAMTKAPVIPVGLWGTEHVWPRSSRLPNVLNITNPPLVTATVGEPVELKYRSVDADTKRIMAAISALLPAEAHEHREPTPEELARTYPAGYEGDPDAELDRRPGTDT